MFQANEDSIVKSLETIAKCILKQTQIAEQSFKEAKELRDYTIGMMKKDIKVQFPQGKELFKSDSDTPKI